MLGGRDNEVAEVDLSGSSVLIVNWRDTSHPEGGGSEVYVEQMAQGLAARGALVTMLCPRYPGAVRREVRDGVHIRRVGGRLSIYLLVPLLALLRRLPPHDAVIEIQNGVPFLAASYLKAPVTVVVHHVHREQWPMLFHRAVARFGWWLEGTVAPRVNRHAPYVTVSTATRDELVDLGVDPERISLVRNGSPDHGDIVHADRTEEPSLVVLGRLVPHKRVEIAIDTLADLLPRHPGLTLTVVGEGWWHSTLVERAVERGVLDRVSFAGHVTDEEKNRELARAWVNCVPSLKEGWGLVIVEAGMNHTPTVAFTSAGGVTESVVDGETGILVDDEPSSFTAAVELLLVDEQLRDQMGKMAEKHAREFTWDASQQRFSEIVRRVLHDAH